METGKDCGRKKPNHQITEEHSAFAEPLSYTGLVIYPEEQIQRLLYRSLVLVLGKQRLDQIHIFFPNSICCSILLHIKS